VPGVYRTAGNPRRGYPRVFSRFVASRGSTPHRRRRSAPAAESACRGYLLQPKFGGWRRHPDGCSSGCGRLRSGCCRSVPCVSAQWSRRAGQGAHAGAPLQRCRNAAGGTLPQWANGPLRRGRPTCLPNRPAARDRILPPCGRGRTRGCAPTLGCPGVPTGLVCGAAPGAWSGASTRDQKTTNKAGMSFRNNQRSHGLDRHLADSDRSASTARPWVGHSDTAPWHRLSAPRLTGCGFSATMTILP